MLVIENTTIKLTRGDTAFLTIPLKKNLYETYELAEGDVLRFTVKKKATNTTPLFQKELTGTNVFHIAPADTAALDFGKYVYDIELTTADGDVYTPIVGEFHVMEEVTW